MGYRGHLSVFKGKGQDFFLSEVDFFNYYYTGHHLAFDSDFFMAKEL
jgi:hypothetical protein